MLANAFGAMTVTSLVATALAAVLWLAGPFTRRHFSAAWHYYVWVAVLAVLVLPVRIRVPEVVSLPPAVSTVLSQTAVFVPAPSAGVQRPVATNPVAPAVQAENLLPLLWCVGAVLRFLVKVIGYAVQRRRLYRRTRPLECPLISQYTRRAVRVRTGAGVASPMLMGAVRPTLFLPDLALTEEQTRHILSHEMTHLRRGDLWVKWFALIVKCLHWFNPAVYIIHRQMQTECEISCDLAAVKHMGEEGAVRYLNTLLFLLSANGGGEHPLATHMLGSKRVIKRRFRMVKEQKICSKTVAWVSAVMAGLMVVGFVCGGGLLAGSTEAPPPAVTTPSVPGSDTPVESTPTTEGTTPTAPGADTTVESAPPTEATTPSVQPVNTLGWPCPSSREIAASYGYRWGQRHNGLDIRAEVGTPVVAAAGGVVTEVATGGYNGGYGQYVCVDHGGGLVTQYAHLSQTAVQVGDTVTAGQPIGAVGVSGVVTGPCLHFTVWMDGEPVDPVTLLS